MNELPNCETDPQAVTELSDVDCELVAGGAATVNVV